MTASTSYQAGELVLIRFMFTTGQQAKDRPALVLLDTGDADVVVARVTSRSAIDPMEVTITDWRAAGLLAPSIVRPHKILTADKTLVRRRIGLLQPADRLQVSAALRHLFGNW
jgi:mRNA interferase MazF